MKRSEMCKNAESRRLAEIFYQHDFFNDEKECDDVYAVLSDIYGALTQDTKEKLCYHYTMLERANQIANQG